MEKNRVVKIAVIGPESTGKTMLCKQLATHFKTKFVPEFARTYFETNNIDNYTFEQLEEIYLKQLQLEKEVGSQVSTILFADTNLISGKVWAQKVFGKVPKIIADNLVKMEFDMYLVCDIDLPWVADEQRKNEADRAELMQAHLNILDQLNLPFELIKGQNEERFQNALKVVETYLKTNNLNLS
jgi:NadR type nicotinamide-nucleotide adenylyltransferase